MLIDLLPRHSSYGPSYADVEVPENDPMKLDNTIDAVTKPISLTPREPRHPIPETMLQKQSAVQGSALALVIAAIFCRYDWFGGGFLTIRKSSLVNPGIRTLYCLSRTSCTSLTSSVLLPRSFASRHADETTLSTNSSAWLSMDCDVIVNFKSTRTTS
jgi:hypothetical protein